MCFFPPLQVLARIANATRPTIHLCEVVSEHQLERLLLLLVGTDFNRGDISWGGAWAQYSLTCMLQDILAGESWLFSQAAATHSFQNPSIFDI